MSDIVVTIPQSFDRKDVLLQLQVWAGQAEVSWHFCVSRLPRELPERMHFVHRGELIGSLRVVGMGRFSGRTLIRPDGSDLKTPRAFAIRAAGDWRTPRQPRRMRGFQGWRYFVDVCGECGGLEAIVDPGGNMHRCPHCAATAGVA